MRDYDYVDLDDKYCVKCKISEQNHRRIVKFWYSIGVSADTILCLALDALDEKEKEREQ